MTVTLTLDIHGFFNEPPGVGVFLRTERGKVAYEVCSYRIVKMKEPQRGMKRVRYQCEKHPIGEVPEGATWFTFHWHRRSRRHRTLERGKT